MDMDTGISPPESWLATLTAATCSNTHGRGSERNWSQHDFRLDLTLPSRDLFNIFVT